MSDMGYLKGAVTLGNRALFPSLPVLPLKVGWVGCLGTQASQTTRKLTWHRFSKYSSGVYYSLEGLCWPIVLEKMCYLNAVVNDLVREQFKWAQLSKLNPRCKQLYQEIVITYFQVKVILDTLKCEACLKTDYESIQVVPFSFHKSHPALNKSKG